MQKSRSEPNSRLGNPLILLNESKRRQSTGVIKRAASSLSQSTKLTSQSLSKVKLASALLYYLALTDSVECVEIAWLLRNPKYPGSCIFEA